MRVARQELDAAFEQPGDRARTLLSSDPHGQDQPQHVQSGSPLGGAGKAQPGLKEVTDGVDVGADHATQGSQHSHRQ